MNFVLDASVALAWGFEDERDDRAMRVLQALRTSEAVTSTIWPLEVSNGLLTAERRGRITPEDASRFSALILELPIAVDPLERRRAFELVRHLARTHRLSIYDASYLDVAVRHGIPLATLDRGLADAALGAGVRLFDPEE